MVVKFAFAGVVIAVVSFASGLAVGKNRYQKFYADFADSEIADAKKYYENRLGKVADEAVQEYEKWLAEQEEKESKPVTDDDNGREYTAEEQLAQFVGDPLESARNAAQEAEASQALTNYQGFFGPSQTSVQELESLTNPEVQQKVLEAFDTPPGSSPFVISQEDFMNSPGEAGGDYPQETWTYYAGDDVLVDESDQIVDGSDRIYAVGNALQHFGENASEPHLVYVRSPITGVDYEIARSEGKYSVEVAGLDEESP